MSTVTVDLATLNSQLTPDLGQIILNPYYRAGVSIDPSTIPRSPTEIPSNVLSSNYLVPNKSYRFSYRRIRYVLMGYLLQTGTAYQSGELEIISTVEPPGTGAWNVSETSDPISPTVQGLIVNQFIKTQNVLDIGVVLGAMPDPSTFPNEPYFGVSYQITTATSFPILRCFVIKQLPTAVPLESK